jgi:endo-1,4-beta-xylanase
MFLKSVFVLATLTSVTLFAQTPSLKDAYKDAFLIGGALSQAIFSGRDARGAALAAQQFNATTPENVLKWEAVHPKPGVYDFTAADQYVEFGEKHGMAVMGHTLVWHSQTPRWVFEDSDGKPATREALIERMRDHIHTVVGRYKGRIRGWDVVNEALNEDGTLRQSPWMKIIGEDYIAMAFRFAHEADPALELYYNDYSVENEAKRKGALELVKKLQAQGIPVAAVGLQDHIRIDWPSAEQIDQTIQAFGALGVKVNITELDIDVLPRAIRRQTADVAERAKYEAETNPYANGLPPAMQETLAKRYAEIFRVYLKNRKIVERVTFWGVTDAGSWLNNWPVPGRKSYPLLFDREGLPKPAFQAVIDVAKQ